MTYKNVDELCEEIRNRFDEAGYYIARVKGDKQNMAKIFNGIWIDLIDEFQQPIPSTPPKEANTT